MTETLNKNTPDASLEVLFDEKALLEENSNLRLENEELKLTVQKLEEQNAALTLKLEESNTRASKLAKALNRARQISNTPAVPVEEVLAF